MFDFKYLDLLADSPPIVFCPSQCASCSITSLQPSSKAAKSAASVQHSATTLVTKEDEDQEDEEEEAGPLGCCLDLNGNVSMPADAAGDSQEGNKAPSAPVLQNESGPEDFELRLQENQQLISQGRAEADFHTLIINTDWFCVLSSQSSSSSSTETNCGCTYGNISQQY